jgi:H/ACA ribonucleoprotein complex subunit 4
MKIEELLDCSFLILDKPRGPSTHEVTSFIRKLLGVKKVGQMGTLDPQASGVLVIGIGKAVRLLRFVDMKEKKYVGVLRTRQAPKNLALLQAEFDKQVGKITQIPPKASAVAKRARQRKVYEYKALELIHNTALFESRVEAGTYVRVLCTEVGKAFGEGKMIELRRVAVGSFDEAQAVRLPGLADAAWKFRKHGDASALQKMLRPAHGMLQLPAIHVAEAAVDAFARGLPLAISGVGGAEAVRKTGEWMQVQDASGRLVAIVEAKGSTLHPRVVLADGRRRKPIDVN